MFKLDRRLLLSNGGGFPKCAKDAEGRCLRLHGKHMANNMGIYIPRRSKEDIGAICIFKNYGYIYKMWLCAGKLHFTASLQN